MNRFLFALTEELLAVKVAAAVLGKPLRRKVHVIPGELRAGEHEEHEHTKSREVAKEIALDHLAENPHYYARLHRAGLMDESVQRAAEKTAAEHRCSGCGSVYAGLGEDGKAWCKACAPGPGKKRSITYEMDAKERAAAKHASEKKSISRQLLLEANKDPMLRGYVHPNDHVRAQERVPIESAGEVVGFFTPREDERGVHRMGAIYVTPAHRGKGLATEAIRGHMAGKRGKAFIEYENKASRRAFEAAGFRAKEEDRRRRGHWYTNEPEAEKTANDPIKNKIEVAGVPVWIEWPRGSTRQYKDKKTGKVAYRCHMEADYGYIPGTLDADGEELDVYVGPDRSAKKCWVIRQLLKKDGSFDEHKLMLGFASRAAAKACYDHHMGDAKERNGGMTEISVSAVRALFADNRKTKMEKKAMTSPFVRGFAGELDKLSADKTYPISRFLTSKTVAGLMGAARLDPTPAISTGISRYVDAHGLEGRIVRGGKGLMNHDKRRLAEMIDVSPERLDSILAQAGRRHKGESTNPLTRLMTTKYDPTNIPGRMIGIRGMAGRVATGGKLQASEQHALDMLRKEKNIHTAKRVGLGAAAAGGVVGAAKGTSAIVDALRGEGVEKEADVKKSLGALGLVSHVMFPTHLAERPVMDAMHHIAPKVFRSAEQAEGRLLAGRMGRPPRQATKFQIPIPRRKDTSAGIAEIVDSLSRTWGQPYIPGPG